MIWIDCNPQAGREMRDRHPLVVLSPRDFNERTGIVIGLPMTTAAGSRRGGWAGTLTGGT
jgi:mRNA interferase MazF